MIPRRPKTIAGQIARSVCRLTCDGSLAIGLVGVVFLSIGDFRQFSFASIRFFDRKPLDFWRVPRFFFPSSGVWCLVRNGAAWRAPEWFGLGRRGKLS